MYVMSSVGSPPIARSRILRYDIQGDAGGGPSVLSDSPLLFAEPSWGNYGSTGGRMRSPQVSSEDSSSFITNVKLSTRERLSLLPTHSKMLIVCAIVQSLFQGLVIASTIEAHYGMGPCKNTHQCNESFQVLALCAGFTIVFLLFDVYDSVWKENFVGPILIVLQSLWLVTIAFSQFMAATSYASETWEEWLCLSTFPVFTVIYVVLSMLARREQGWRIYQKVGANIKWRKSYEVYQLSCGAFRYAFQANVMFFVSVSAYLFLDPSVWRKETHWSIAKTALYACSLLTAVATYYSGRYAARTWEVKWFRRHYASCAVETCCVVVEMVLFYTLKTDTGQIIRPLTFAFMLFFFFLSKGGTIYCLHALSKRMAVGAEPPAISTQLVKNKRAYVMAMPSNDTKDNAVSDKGPVDDDATSDIFRSSPPTPQPSHESAGTRQTHLLAAQPILSAQPDEQLLAFGEL